MKKIEIDLENGTALLEPGVGFYDLYDYLEANRIPLWLSVPGNSWGSVIGNALDRGVGYTPYGQNTSKLCGMEVVLADGSLVRTGMGAMEGGKSWSLYPYGFGPGWDQMFVQSNLGIVTRANLWLMPEPESVMGMDVEFDHADDLGPLIDTIGPLRREGLLQQSRRSATGCAPPRSSPGAPTGRSARRAFRSGRRDPQALRHGLVGRVAAALRARGGQQGRLSDPREGDERLEADGVQVHQMGSRRAQGAERLVRRAAHLPDAERQLARRARRAIGFSPVLPQSGAQAMAQFKRTYSRYKEYGMDYQASFAFGERHLINVNAVLLDQDDAAMMQRVDPFLRALIGDARAQGYGEYRTHLDYMDTVAATYDFGGHALLKLNETVKNALDPNGIIAPGKSGIWPRAYAGERGQVRAALLAATLVALPVAALAGAKKAPPPGPQLDGKALFHEKCGMCHNASGMGTGLLSRRVKPALLEERTDLAADYVLTAARTGIGNMPAIPRGEASDAQLGAIAGYLTDPKRLKPLKAAEKAAARQAKKAARERAESDK